MQESTTVYVPYGWPKSSLVGIRAFPYKESKFTAQRPSSRYYNLRFNFHSSQRQIHPNETKIGETKAKKKKKKESNMTANLPNIHPHVVRPMSLFPLLVASNFCRGIVALKSLDICFFFFVFFSPFSNGKITRAGFERNGGIFSVQRPPSHPKNAIHQARKYRFITKPSNSQGYARKKKNKEEKRRRMNVTASQKKKSQSPTIFFDVPKTNSSNNNNNSVIIS